MSELFKEKQRLIEELQWNTRFRLNDAIRNLKNPQKTESAVEDLKALVEVLIEQIHDLGYVLGLERTEKLLRCWEKETDDDQN